MDTAEPVGYDGFGAPLYAHQIDIPDPYPGFIQRWICGVDPGDIDPEDLKLSPNAIWQIPEPMTIEIRHVDPELLEIMFGQPVVPLCYRQIPTEGTE